ncbi:hypothetical protein [Ligaoa zhengdingensis]|uniref:hypothetical protein n=2 Tax=Ligaoa zhengdingensis TaxID=2763658 RepID=UPI0031BB0F63
MMNQLKKGFTILLTAVLCLSLTACGGAKEDIVGDDWRVSGVVVDSGTITHDGDSVDVLVTISPESAAFYRDSSEQVLFDSVSFPMTISDAEDAFNSISFNDMDGDGESDVLVSFIHENGDTTELIWIWDPVERYVFREDLSTVTISGGDLDEYVGLWEYQGENLWLKIHDDATWEFVNDQDDVIEYGTLWVDENGVTLHFDGSGDVLQLDRTVSGDLIDTANDGTLVPVEGIQSSEPYFSRNDLEINAAVEKGTFLLKDGACSYAALGDGYSVGDCYWEVTKGYDYTHDGIRELQFDAICYIPDSSIPYFDQQYVTNTDSELYDFYTGMWFTAASSYGNSSRGKNYYLHTVSWRGNSYLIEFAYSTDWQYNVGDWAAVLTKSYVVYLPEDYDGLVFAAETQPDNYKDSAKRMQLDSISPEAGIMDIDTVDPYSSLYFSICY